MPLRTFLSPDPEMGEPSDPKLRLPYAYCASDPVNNWDPTGRRLVEEDPARELHYTSQSLTSISRRKGTTPTLEASRRSSYLKHLNAKRALARAQAALMEDIRPSDLSSSTLSFLRSMGMDPLSFKRGVFSRLTDASPAQILSLVKEMGRSHRFTEQDLRYFLSRALEKEKLVEAYLEAFRLAGEGAYDIPSMWEELGGAFTEVLGDIGAWFSRNAGTILGIASGVLQAAGTFCVATGVGAPVGAALIGVGAGMSLSSTVISVNKARQLHSQGLMSDQEYNNYKMVAGVLWFANLIPPTGVSSVATTPVMTDYLDDLAQRR